MCALVESEFLMTEIADSHGDKRSDELSDNWVKPDEFDQQGKQNQIDRKRHGVNRIHLEVFRDDGPGRFKDPIPIYKKCAGDAQCVCSNGDRNVVKRI